MTHSTDAGRAEFERSVAAEMYGGLVGLISDHWNADKGEYTLFQHQVAWVAWKAARRAPAAPVPQGWRELCRRLYVELFHCDQQMRNTLRRGKPIWEQGATVRDVLADAKSALAAAPQPPEVGHDN